MSAPRTTIRDETTLTAMAWCSERLIELSRTVVGMADSVVARIAEPVDALASVVRDYLVDVSPLRPGRLDLLSLAGSGRPWTTLEAVASPLVNAEADLTFLAYEIIEPDPELEWRLFHISTLGVVLATLRAQGARVRWLAPLSAATPGPNFRAEFGSGRSWDIWFEAHQALRHYGVESPYRLATTAVTSREASIGADVLIVAPGKAALALECKWSDRGSYVSRDGFHQASAYALELRHELAPRVRSFVVGAAEVVRGSSQVELENHVGVLLGVTDLEELPKVVSSFVGGTEA